MCICQGLDLSSNCILGNFPASFVLSFAHLGAFLLTLANESTLAPVLSQNTRGLEILREAPQESIKTLVVSHFDLHVQPPPFGSYCADPPETVGHSLNFLACNCLKQFTQRLIIPQRDKHFRLPAWNPEVASRFAILTMVYGSGFRKSDRGYVSNEVGILYCGSCGAMNPRTNHYCSACGHALVDAYHASEGLRVYTTADTGSALVDIVDPGADITVLETQEELPADFVKVNLPDGRTGYVRLREVERVAGDIATAEPTRREPVGCISSSGLLAIILLSIVVAALALVTAFNSTDANADFLAVLSCIVVVPFFLLVIGFYLYVRKREDEIMEEREAELASRQNPPTGGPESS